MQRGSGFRPFGASDIHEWMKMRQGERSGAPTGWAGGTRPGEDFAARRQREIADARARLIQRDRDELRRTGEAIARDNFDLRNPSAWTIPHKGLEAAFEISKRAHEALLAYFKEHDLGAEARDQSYLYGPRNGYNPYDDMPPQRRR